MSQVTVVCHGDECLPVATIVVARNKCAYSLPRHGWRWDRKRAVWLCPLCARTGAWRAAQGRYAAAHWVPLGQQWSACKRILFTDGEVRSRANVADPEAPRREAKDRPQCGKCLAAMHKAQAVRTITERLVNGVRRLVRG